MMSLLSGERDLLEQSLLERLGAQVGGTEEYGSPRVGRAFRAEAEFLAIVGSEVRVVPIAFKDRGYFVDDIRIARARNAHIPFESADLGRVREIRRTNVGGGKPGLPV